MAKTCPMEMPCLEGAPTCDACRRGTPEAKTSEYFCRHCSLVRDVPAFADDPCSNGAPHDWCQRYRRVTAEASHGSCLLCGGPCTLDLIDGRGQPYKGCPKCSRRRVARAKVAAAHPCIACVKDPEEALFCATCASEMVEAKGPFPETYEAHGINIAGPRPASATPDEWPWHCPHAVPDCATCKHSTAAKEWRDLRAKVRELNAELRDLRRASAAPEIGVRDMSDSGEGPWRLMVNGHGCADWPWDATEHNPEDYAEEVARVVRKALRASPVRVTSNASPICAECGGVGHCRVCGGDREDGRTGMLPVLTERPCPCCSGTNHRVARWECDDCRRQFPYRDVPVRETGSDPRKGVLETLQAIRDMLDGGYPQLAYDTLARAITLEKAFAETPCASSTQENEHASRDGDGHGTGRTGGASGAASEARAVADLQHDAGSDARGAPSVPLRGGAVGSGGGRNVPTEVSHKACATQEKKR